mgnify:CR=1 FL=1
MNMYLEQLVIIILIVVIAVSFNIKIVLSNKNFKVYWEKIDTENCSVEIINSDYKRLYIEEEGEVIYEKIKER